MPASETIPQDVRSADPLFAGPPQKAEWMSDLPKSDWLFDGYPIRGEVMLSRFEALDWSKAWVDMGPSIAGNLGPYWHVPLVGDDETVHRLYPKLLQSKWLPLVRQAVSEAVARATAAERERCARVADAEWSDAMDLFDEHNHRGSLTDTNGARITGRQSAARAIAAAIRSGDHNAS